jgi:hypothetical protein
MLSYRIPYSKLQQRAKQQELKTENTNLQMAVPFGKKGALYITFDKENIIYLFINIKESKIISKTIIHNINYEWSIGTLFYGTIYYENNNTNLPIKFFIEDIILYKGVDVSQRNFISDKIPFIYDFLSLKLIQNVYLCSLFNEQTKSPLLYKVYIIKNINTSLFQQQQQEEEDTPPPSAAPTVEKKKLKKNHFKPQYKIPTIFKVTADTEEEIYNLYTYDKGRSVFYDYLLINSFKDSIALNKIFRKMPQNDNLDLIEESDDEEEFENPQSIVNLDKEIFIECVFNYKFKKWQFLRVIEPAQGQQNNNYNNYKKSDYYISLNRL